MAQFSALSLAAVSVASLAAVGGGVSYAAKDAQPGDLLYPIHANMYGEASAEAEAQAELDEAQDIFDEALRLDAQGSLSAEAMTDLSKDYDTHVDAVQKLIVELEAEGKTSEAANIRAMLQAQMNAMTDAFKASDSDSSAAHDGDVDADSSASVDANSSTSVEASDANTSVTGDVEIDAHTDADAAVDLY